MRPAWLLTLLATLAGAAHAAPMSFEAALKFADQSAPSLQARAADVRAARLSAVAAGRLPDPKLAFGVEGYPVSGPNAGHPERDDFSDVRVGVMQDVPNGAKRRAARDRATADIGAAEVGGAVEGRNVRLNTALAWIDLYYAQQRLVTLDDVGRALAPLRTTAASRLASSAARPGETLQPEQWNAALADRRAALVANVAKAKSELVRWTGEVEPEVAGSPPDYTIDPIALRAGLEDLPALRVYDATARQADADVATAKADKRPDTSWELAYQRRDPRFGDMVMAQVTVSLPLFASTRQDPIIAARAQTATRVRTEREAARRELRAALDSSLADHIMHHEQLMRATETLVPLAKRRADLESASYAAGTASLSDVLSALLALAEARTDAVDRQADVARDAVRIALTYGKDAQ
jgi:outer membrane protein TolC